jgi:hypothetical protein
MPMSPPEAFKAGFLLGCADLGLSAAETHALVKRAIGPGAGKVIGEMIEAPGRVLSSVGPAVLNAGLAAAIGLPVLAGGTAGWAAAKLRDDDTDVDAAKADELVAEYQRLADQARRQAAAKALALRPPGGAFRLPTAAH